MKQKILKNKILIIFLSLLILVISCLNLNKLYGAIVVPDEIGYWATGYFFNGTNWNRIMGTSSYYGWGYGIILSLILKVVSNPIWAYRSAIFLNGVFLVLIFIKIQN